MHKLFKKIVLFCTVAALVVIPAVSALAAYEFESWPRFDLGGATVVIVKDREGSLPEEGTEFYDRWKAVEEFFNCKIEMIWTGQYNYQDIVARMMAGDPVDIVRLEGNIMQNMISLGLMQPLNEVWGPTQLDQFGFPDWIKQEFVFANTLSTYNGKIYATQAYDRDEGPYLSGNAFLWNKSMFERAGLPSLYDIIEEDPDGWTWDKLFELAQILTQDTDGDGVIDQFGMGKRLTLRQGFTLLATNGGALTRDVDGRVVVTIDEPAVVETVNFIRKCVEAGVTTLSKPNAADDNIEFQQGNIAFNFQHGVEYWRGIEWWYTPELMQDDWGIAPFPKGPNGEGLVSARPVSDTFLVGVPISSRYYPQAMLALFTALYPRNPNLIDEYIDKYGRLVRDEEDFEAVMKYFLNVSGDLTQAGMPLRHWSLVWNTMKWTDATTGLIDYTTHVAEILPSLQTSVDEMFNNL